MLRIEEKEPSFSVSQSMPIWTFYTLIVECISRRRSEFNRADFIVDATGLCVSVIR